MKHDPLFMGKNGYVWWFGTVVSNADPLGVGRCRVRISGWHSEDVRDLPNEALPWAYPILPITNTGTGGAGSSPVGPVPNTRVFGFFLDGELGQQPIMTGVLAGKKYTDQESSATTQPLEYGSTVPYPNKDDLIAPTAIDTEDCPEGYTAGDTINLSLPDPRNLEINKSEWSIPFTGFVSSAYGERGGQHYGVDICPAGVVKQTSKGTNKVKNALSGQAGLPVYAAADGEVVFIWTADKGSGGRPTQYDKFGPGTGNSRSFGNAIAIRHTLSGGTYTTIYAHLGVNQDAALDKPGAGISVRVGDKVKKGQQIGTVGRSHNFSELTHLHFEIRVGTALPRNSNHINPGRIFPQLTNRHDSIRSWCETQTKFDVEPYIQPEDAPVRAFDPPK